MAANFLLSVVICILGLCITGVEAVVCKYTRHTFFEESVDIRFCPYACCGSHHHQFCCGTSIGVIVGSVIGCTIFIAFVITIICCCVRRRYFQTVRTNNMIAAPVVYHTASAMASNPTGTTTTVQYNSQTFSAPPPYGVADSQTFSAPPPYGVADSQTFSAPPPYGVAVSQTAVPYDNYGFKN